LETHTTDKTAFTAGSFNLDPRSVSLKTEMGMLVESETLAKAEAESSGST